MALVALAAAAYGARLRTVRQHEAALREIAARGGLVHVYNYGTQVFFEKLPPLYCTHGLQRMIEPAIHADRFGDSDCGLFEDVMDLYAVHFAGSGVSPNGVQAFRRRYPNCQVHTKAFAEWE